MSQTFLNNAVYIITPDTFVAGTPQMQMVLLESREAQQAASIYLAGQNVVHCCAMVDGRHAIGVEGGYFSLKRGGDIVKQNLGRFVDIVTGWNIPSEMNLCGATFRQDHGRSLVLGS
ncbi:MAG: hypothetical protein J0L97_04835 [Alphaproteobacteria bacterium]|nr:hypothetical protein [Alphaproteobacteria bacterium]